MRSLARLCLSFARARNRALCLSFARARNRALRLSCLGLLLLLNGSCVEELAATEVVVLIDSDLAVGSELTSLDISVYNRQGTVQLHTRTLQLGQQPSSPGVFRLPLTFSLQEQNQESADFRLVVTGRRGGEAVVEQQVLTSFRSNTALLLTVFLARSCAANLCRAAGSDQTCDSRSGQCVPIPVAMGLPEAEGDGLEDYQRPDFAAVSQDGAVPSAGAMDGGVAVSSDAAGPSPSLEAGPGGAMPAADAAAPTLDAAAAPRDAAAPSDAGVAPPTDSGGPSPSEDGGAVTDAGSVGPADAGSSGPTPTLPPVVGTCPVLATGTATILGASVRLWVGPKRGPLHVYWHGTGTNSGEVNSFLPAATTAVTSEGGMVASFETSSQQGTNTSGTGIWRSGDLQAVDQLVACGVAQGWVDARRIHAAGYSAGGMQTSAMVLLRSSYLASAFVYSAGLVEDIDAGGTSLQDPSNVPSVGFGHGAKGMDALVGIDMADLSRVTATKLRMLGGFTFDCDDGGSHIALTRGTTLGPSVLQFFKDHPYKTKPSPYASALPSSWPNYCRGTP
jgi:predicted esterase